MQRLQDPLERKIRRLKDLPVYRQLSISRRSRRFEELEVKRMDEKLKIPRTSKLCKSGRMEHVTFIECSFFADPPNESLVRIVKMRIRVVPRSSFVPGRIAGRKLFLLEKRHFISMVSLNDENCFVIRSQG